MFIIQKLIQRKKLRESLTRKATLDESYKLVVHPNAVIARGRRKATCAEIENLKNNRLPSDCPMAIMALLSDDEQRALKVTWSHMKGTGSLRNVTKLMNRNFEFLIARKPKIKTVFHNSAFLLRDTTTIYDHALILAKYVDSIINSHLYRQEDMLATKQIGAAHSNLWRCGFDGEMLEQFGLIFSECFALQDCVRAYPNAARAWNVLIAALTDQFRAYYEQSRKRVSSQSCFCITPQLGTRKSASVMERTAYTEKIQRRNISWNISRENCPADKVSPGMKRGVSFLIRQPVAQSLVASSQLVPQIALGAGSSSKRDTPTKTRSVTLADIRLDAL